MSDALPETGRGTSADAGASGVPNSLAPRLARRMACCLYEGMLVFGVVFIAAYLFGTLSQTRNAMDHRHALQAFVFVVLGIYFTWFWAKGQTLAMKTWHIRIVDAHGAQVTQQRALCRYVASWLWLLPPLALVAPLRLSTRQTFLVVACWVTVWALVSRLHPQRQFLHDAIAGTRLVSTAPPRTAVSA
ncbi:RDD family protein [Xylophilus ampelinus]